MASLRAARRTLSCSLALTLFALLLVGSAQSAAAAVQATFYVSPSGNDTNAGTIAVVGSNGSGKSTLLGVLAGVVAPAAGAVEIGTRRPALVVQHSAVPAGLPITV